MRTTGKLLVTTACLLVSLATGASAQSAAQSPAWNGVGKYRLLVRVPARKLKTRRNDSLPADLAIDFVRELQRHQVSRRPNLATLQVQRYDPISKKTIPDGEYAYGRTSADRPFRWHDAAIPYDFPEFGGAVSRTGGKIVRRPKLRGGQFYNVLGDWKRGRLTWMHTQAGQADSYYAVYFDLLESKQQPQTLPPRGWLGDGLPRCDRMGTTSMGADHCRLDLDDWNDDGLVDLIVGEHYGRVLWWPNLGTRKQPVFRYARFVSGPKGPLDAGIGAAPKVVDWDGDGNKDLLVGTHWNRLLFYKNLGTNKQRRLSYQGPVMLAGKPLEVPFTPLTRGSPSVFKRDYYPVPECVDWDGDGDTDLLLGGYVTGLVFFYENVGKSSNGTPQLKLHGPLQSGGKPLNVRHWCAAPLVADFDSDGDLDLMSGNMPMHVQANERASNAETFLQIFTNGGTRTQPKLGLARFPRSGSFPRERLATPRAFDWDADGDLDLVVSARQNIYLFRNTGSRHRPQFEVHSKPLQVPWGLAPIAVDQFRDWDGDGRTDLVRGYSARLRSKAGNPYRWQGTQSVLPTGKHISHPSGIGDDWFWPYLDDFDKDGQVDVLFGDWYGHVWFHRNRSKGKDRQFDLQGFRLQLTNGPRIKVGPINKDPKKDFDALQGARTVLTAADFDRDGRRDLVIGDTYGKIRYFRQADKAAEPNSQPRFESGVEMGDLGIRGLVDATDWNHDGWPDVIASAANGRVRVFLNKGKNGPGRFSEGMPVKLPPIIQPRVLIVDLNNDGDDDLFLPSTQGSCFVERSFLEHGYAKAVLLAVERKP